MQVGDASGIALRHDRAAEAVELARVHAQRVVPRTECVYRGLAIGSTRGAVAVGVVDVAF